MALQMTGYKIPLLEFSLFLGKKRQKYRLRISQRWFGELCFLDLVFNSWVMVIFLTYILQVYSINLMEVTHCQVCILRYIRRASSLGRLCVYLIAWLRKSYKISALALGSCFT